MVIAIIIFLILGILQSGFFVIRMTIEGMLWDNIIFSCLRYYPLLEFVLML